MKALRIRKIYPNFLRIQIPRAKSLMVLVKTTRLANQLTSLKTMDFSTIKNEFVKCCKKLRSNSKRMLWKAKRILSSKKTMIILAYPSLVLRKLSSMTWLKLMKNLRFKMINKKFQWRKNQWLKMTKIKIWPTRRTKSWASKKLKLRKNSLPQLMNLLRLKDQLHLKKNGLKIWNKSFFLKHGRPAWLKRFLSFIIKRSKLMTILVKVNRVEMFNNRATRRTKRLKMVLHNKMKCRISPYSHLKILWNRIIQSVLACRIIQTINQQIMLKWPRICSSTSYNYNTSSRTSLRKSRFTILKMKR